MRVRVDRLLANLGYGSRREVQALIAAGEVSLDGTRVVQASAHVHADVSLAARMTVADEPLDPPSPLTLVLNKPLGVVCSHREAGRRIYELFPERWRRRTPALSTIGRLDADTSGLIIVTDDGALNHRIISPRAHVAKRYLATLARPLGGHEAALFASGALTLEGDDKPLSPAELETLETTLARLTIHEGRYHQVRRMFAAAGNHVLALHREKVGGLELPPELAPGGWRIASSTELAAVFA